MREPGLPGVQAQGAARERAPRGAGLGGRGPRRDQRAGSGRGAELRGRGRGGRPEGLRGCRGRPRERRLSGTVTLAPGVGPASRPEPSLEPIVVETGVDGPALHLVREPRPVRQVGPGAARRSGGKRADGGRAVAAPGGRGLGARGQTYAGAAQPREPCVRDQATRLKASRAQDRTVRLPQKGRRIALAEEGSAHRDAGCGQRLVPAPGFCRWLGQEEPPSCV